MIPARARGLLCVGCGVLGAALAMGLAASAGRVWWQEDGRTVCAEDDYQTYPSAVGDGHGGAIVAWEDGRDGDHDIYAQRLDPDGKPLWQAGGVPLCAAIEDQDGPQIVSDGAGGAILTWWDSRNGNGYDVYAQRVDGAGNPLWQADGVSLCTASGDQRGPRMVSDGQGGAIVCWEDHSNPATEPDVYAQRVNPAGATLWQAGGVTLCAAANAQTDPEIAPDGAGGAMVAWADGRASLYSQIYAQRVYANGSMAWAEGGAGVCTTSAMNSDPAIASDGAGGAVLAWQAHPSGEGYYEIYAQRMSAGGDRLWITGGVTVAPPCTTRTIRRS